MCYLCVVILVLTATYVRMDTTLYNNLPFLLHKLSKSFVAKGKFGKPQNTDCITSLHAHQGSEFP